jgi:hypothetical protein
MFHISVSRIPPVGGQAGYASPVHGNLFDNLSGDRAEHWRHGEAERAMMAVSISTSLRTGAMIGTTLSDWAAVPNEAAAGPWRRPGSGLAGFAPAPGPTIKADIPNSIPS